MRHDCIPGAHISLMAAMSDGGCINIGGFIAYLRILLGTGFIELA